MITARSIAFYQAFLTALGFRRWKIAAPEWSGDHPTRATWGKKYSDGSRFDIEVRNLYAGEFEVTNPGAAYDQGPSRGATSAEITAHTRELESVRSRLTELISGT